MTEQEGGAMLNRYCELVSILREVKMGVLLTALMGFYFVSFHSSAATSCQSVFKLRHPNNLMILTENEDNILAEAFQINMDQLIHSENYSEGLVTEEYQILGDIIQNHRHIMYVYNGLDFRHEALHVHLKVPYKDRTYIDETAIKIWEAVGSFKEFSLKNAQNKPVEQIIKFDTGRSE